MAVNAKAVLARLSYGALFCLVLPASLAAWAMATRDLIALPPYGNPILGAVAALIGGALMLWAFGALRFQGGGLPMNAFPPPRYVTTGPYRALPHPIYVGFTLACLGVSMMARSASGLWLVSPVAGLGCAALVLGFEAQDLERRFGAAIGGRRSWLPEASGDRPRLPDHFRFFLFVLLPWFALYQIAISLGVPNRAIDLAPAFDRRLPLWPWTQAIYASAYLAAPLASFLTATRQDLRALTIRAWLAMALAFPVYLALPVATFPPFQVLWAFLIAEGISGRNPRLRAAARVWAWAVALSCVTTGKHSIADVVAGVIFAGLLLHADRVWDWLRGSSERIANSWREWRIGPVRIINHGIYGGAAAFSAVAIAGVAVGPGHNAAISVTAVGALVGAALWAQWVEGSSHLLRPFGFFGGLFGVAATAWLGLILGWDPWLLMAAYCLASPVMQSIGRLRCLVQGCCHGRPALPAIGIRYRHPRSRVLRIARLEGLPLHPTPLYSILWNGFVALVLGRLWLIGAPLHLIAGVFAILTGLGRFVEEGYRGEPQTPVFAGLRLYQWIALGTVLAGAVITSAGPGAGAPPPVLYPDAFLLASAFGLLSAFALGVDFPESNRRFTRLA